jgi:lysozyme
MLGSMALLMIVPLAGQQPHPPVGTIQQTLALESRTARAGHYTITPERRALLNTIRYAEGTWLGGAAEGYRTLFGGGRFQNLDHHPEVMVDRGYVSAAAGAYQFLPGTWRAVARELNLSDFRPESQDQAALRLVERRGALQSFDRDGLSLEVLARLSPEWASLPDSQGTSAYGQPVKAGIELQRFYAQQLDRQRRGFSA